MKVVKNKLFPFKGYKYINLFGIIFCRTDAKISDVEYNHEKIHLKQMQEMLWIFFYLWYGIEYVVVSICNLGVSQGDRYHEISFEEEAYLNQYDFSYCKERKHYNWLKYINVKSYQRTNRKNK